MAPFTILEDDSAELPDRLATAKTRANKQITIATNSTKLGTWQSLPDNVRAQIIQHAIPAYTTVFPSHPASEAIPITIMKAYIKVYCTPFRVDSNIRRLARQHCATINNIGASISLHSPDDTTAVVRLGWDILTTVMIDVHLTYNIQPVALMAMIASAKNVKYLHLTTFTDSNRATLPEMWEDEGEVMEFLVDHGVAFVRAMFKVRKIDIDMVSEATTAKISPWLARFVQEAWMNKKRKRDTPLAALLKRVLFNTRPTVTVSAASDSKSYSNDPFC